MQQLTASANKLYDGFCGFIEKENRMTEFGLYGLSSAVLIYAYVRKRPLSKFTKASDIPVHFIREKVIQHGIVRKIEPTEHGPLLLVNHKPPVSLPLQNRALPIKVAGVQIDGNGYSWLQILATKQEVKFIPVSNTGNECLAQVFLVQPERKDLDIGRALVGLGFARAAPLEKELEADVKENFARYYKQLVSSEKKARSLRKGQWHIVPEFWLRWYLRTSYEKIMFRMKSEHMKLPPLVR